MPNTPAGYHDHDGFKAAIADAEQRGARRFVYGTSVQGQPLVGLEIGPPMAETISVLLAGVHPIEWIGVECGLAAIDRLLEAPPRDRRVVVFPLVNVDGYRAVEADLQDGVRRFRRGNAHGVDLNRNFPSFFKKNGLRAAFLPWEHPHGAHALSEPEIAGVVSHLEHLSQKGYWITHALSLHSFGRKVLYPYGSKLLAAPDEKRLRDAAVAFCARTAGGYKPVQSARWVPGFFAPGMELDHLYERFGATSLLVECGFGGRSLREPTTYLSPFDWFNPRDPRLVVNDVAPAVDWFLRGATA